MIKVKNNNMKKIYIFGILVVIIIIYGVIMYNYSDKIFQINKIDNNVQRIQELENDIKELSRVDYKVNVSNLKSNLEKERYIVKDIIVKDNSIKVIIKENYMVSSGDKMPLLFIRLWSDTHDDKRINNYIILLEDGQMDGCRFTLNQEGMDVCMSGDYMVCSEKIKQGGICE